MVALNTQAGKAALSDRRNDLYETPAVAVDALARVEQLPPRIWEPACGPGAIVNALRTLGHIVIATDLVDYGLDGAESGVDFLMEPSRSDIDAVVTNPPFKLAAEFVERALETAPLVIMLLRLAFLESTRRAPILDGGKLARVHIFRNRLPMMHRDGWTGNKVSNPTAFAWFVWDREHCGPAVLNRISWNEPKVAA